MRMYMYCKYECVYAYARVFCIQTRYDLLRFLAAFVAHSLCEIHHTHTGIRTHTHTHTYAKGWYCSRWRIVIVLYTLTFLFTSFPVSIARTHSHIQLQLARLQPRPFLLCRFFYLGLFAFFLVFSWQQQSPFYRPRPNLFRLLCGLLFSLYFYTSRLLLW